MLLSPLRWALTIVAILLGLIVLYFAVTLVQVWLTSRDYDPRPAGAIVVLGAAQYNGRPSPDLEARLRQALTLYRDGYAHMIVVTGGKKPGDVYTEAETGAMYLEKAGVPAADIVQAGGDCVNGGGEVVDAVAHGKKAALGIHQMLAAAKGRRAHA